MTTILNFLKGLFANKNLFIFILVGIIVLLMMTKLDSCSGKRRDDQQAKQNMEAMKKELTVTQNKNKELQYNIVAFEGKVKDLGSYSEDLKKEVDALKGRTPKTIIKFKTIYVGDTIEVPTGVVNNGNGNYDLPWSYVSPDSTRELAGKSAFVAKFDTAKKTLDIKPGKTSITRDILKMDFTVGVAKNKKTGLDEIFVTPKNSNLIVGKLEGAILDKPKDKKYSIGLSIGYGITYNSKGLGAGPFIGVSLTRSLFKF